MYAIISQMDARIGTVADVATEADWDSCCVYNCPNQMTAERIVAAFRRLEASEHDLTEEDRENEERVMRLAFRFRV